MPVDRIGFTLMVFHPRMNIPLSPFHLYSFGGLGNWLSVLFTGISITLSL